MFLKIQPLIPKMHLCYYCYTSLSWEVRQEVREGLSHSFILSLSAVWYTSKYSLSLRITKPFKNSQRFMFRNHDSKMTSKLRDLTPGHSSSAFKGQPEPLTWRHFFQVSVHSALITEKRKPVADCPENNRTVLMLEVILTAGKPEGEQRGGRRTGPSLLFLPWGTQTLGHKAAVGTAKNAKKHTHTQRKCNSKETSNQRAHLSSEYGRSFACPIQHSPHGLDEA